MDDRQVKVKKAGSGAASGAASNAAPTTFFLKTEREMEMELDLQRGRRPSRSAETSFSKTEPLNTMTESMAQSSFGVQSLADTINSTFGPESDLSRTPSHSADESPEGNGIVHSRKRKAGNPVHPKIRSAGHRIISSERRTASSSNTGSPISIRSAESPLRMLPIRRESISPSPARHSRPFTPVKASPSRGSIASPTLHLASPKSYRLSDEETSMPDESKSQAIESSNDEEEHIGDPTQLIMPSLAMPARRPFTEHGKAMGRLAVMVIGPGKIGKTSLIQNMLRSSEHIVHVDAHPGVSSIQGSDAHKAGQSATKFIELSASTKPLPSWWSDIDPRRGLQRRMSTGDVLERNLKLIDTPALDEDGQSQQIEDFISDTLRRSYNMNCLNDNEIIAMLSGEGGTQIDVVLYLCNPHISNGTDTEASGISLAQQELLMTIGRWTNVIPLIGRCDEVDSETLRARKEQVRKLLSGIGVDLFKFSTIAEQPLAVSSAVGDDTSVIDASVLMSSQYVPPLLPSELDELVSQLFSHTNIARLRRLSAIKSLNWRKEHATNQLLHRDHSFLHTPHSGYHSPGLISFGSALEDTSKVLVPYGASSYYRSASPSLSEASALPASTYALARYNDQAGVEGPIREVITAKWAQDLSFSREKETRSYMEHFRETTVGLKLGDDPEKNDSQALVSAREPQRPPRGRLGGALGIIDPSDPLGVLALTHAFRSRGLLAMQIAGGCGLLGAVCYCLVRYLMNIQDVWILGSPTAVITPHAVPAPARSSFMGWDSNPLRGYLSWVR